MVVSTYQSVTGTGKNAVDQLNNEEQGVLGKMVYPYPIYRNALPHIDVFESNGYTKEEMKIVMKLTKFLIQRYSLQLQQLGFQLKEGIVKVLMYLLKKTSLWKMFCKY